MRKERCLWRTKREPERKLGRFILKPFILDWGALATVRS